MSYYYKQYTNEEIDELNRYYRYKQKAKGLTRTRYKWFKDDINPDDLPIGTSGQKNAHHVDHIVSIKICYKSGIPAHICAHPDNLRVVHWLWNARKGSRLLKNDIVPIIFERYNLIY